MGISTERNEIDNEEFGETHLKLKEKILPMEDSMKMISIECELSFDQGM